MRDLRGAALLHQGRRTFRIVATALLLVGGCGPRSDRLDISGHVTLDGAPLDGGSIRFSSVGDGKLMAAGAMIQNGAYHIPQQKGLLPGSYHLEINAPDAHAPPVMVRTAPGGPGIAVAPERIPAEYNVNCDKTVDVTADGTNQFDFNIASVPKK